MGMNKITQPENTLCVFDHEEVPVDQRIDSLLDSMGALRDVLVGILEACRTPRSSAEVSASVEEAQRDNISVYTGGSLCAVLEKAGALRRVNQDGSPQGEGAARPRVVEVGGVPCLEPVSTRPFWLSTEEGLAAAVRNSPLERTLRLVRGDDAYRGVYLRVLGVCSRGEGASAADIAAAVDDDPLLQEPKLYAGSFIEKLERSGAIAWRKAWRVTEAGSRALGLLGAQG